MVRVSTPSAAPDEESKGLKSPFWFLTRMSARFSLIAASILTVVTYLLLSCSARPIPEYGAKMPQTLMWSTDPAGRAQSVVEGLTPKTSPGQPATNLKETAIRVFEVDYAFLTAFFVALSLGCEVASRSSASACNAKVLRFVAWVALAGGVFDVIEDSMWLVMINYSKYSPYAEIAAWSTRVKWVIVIFVPVYLGICVLARIVCLYLPNCSPRTAKA